MDFVNDRLGSGSEEDDDERSGDDNQKIDPNRPCVIRSKGFFWLASRPQEMMLWSQAGGLFQLSPGGGWWADTPREFWPEDEESVAQIKADWVEPDGDRR
jgi:G3E family GTPase